MEKCKWIEYKRFRPFPSFYKQFAFFHANQTMVNRFFFCSNWKGDSLQKWSSILFRLFIDLVWFFFLSFWKNLVYLASCLWISFVLNSSESTEPNKSLVYFFVSFKLSQIILKNMIEKKNTRNRTNKLQSHHLFSVKFNGQRKYIYRKICLGTLNICQIKIVNK